MLLSMAEKNPDEILDQIIIEDNSLKGTETMGEENKTWFITMKDIYLTFAQFSLFHPHGEHRALARVPPSSARHMILYFKAAVKLLCRNYHFGLKH